MMHKALSLALAVGLARASSAPVWCYRNSCGGGVQPAGMESCGSHDEKLARWKQNYAAGDRLSLVVRYSCEDAATCYDNSLLGWISSHLRCVAKGPAGHGSGEIAAYVDSNLQKNSIEFHTKRPCQFYPLHQEFVLTNPGEGEVPEASSTEEPTDEIGSSGTEEPSDSAESSGWHDRRLVGGNCSNMDSLYELYQTPSIQDVSLDSRCPYIQFPASETVVRPPPSSWPADKKWAWSFQHSFLGPRFEVSSVNGEWVGDQQHDASESREEYLIEFGEGSSESASVCDDTHNDHNPDAAVAIYDGGVHILSRRGSYLTTRMYQFKNEAQRDAARAASLADASGQTNPGLMYAHLVDGMSGCDVELVFEVTPKAGGGLELEFGFPLFAFTHERQARLRSSAAVWISESAEHGGTVHFVVQSSALQHAQIMPCADSMPEDAYEALGSFALTFVCEASGGRVTAEMFVRLADGSMMPSADISRNSSAPTLWAAGGQADAEGAPTFRFELTAEQAPESCGVMFFDPLFKPPEGDGLLLKPAQEFVQDGGRGDGDGVEDYRGGEDGDRGGEAGDVDYQGGEDGEGVSAASLAAGAPLFAPLSVVAAALFALP